MSTHVVQLEVTLKDILDDQVFGSRRKRTIKVKVEANERGIAIYPQGYGEQSAVKGHGCPILIELADDKLRAILWTDINAADPQIINLEGAKESARKP
jgi:hypothetical protein